LDRDATVDGRKVLIVEDEPLIAMLLADMLNELGFDVDTSGGRLASAMEAAAASQWRCVILDVRLGDEETYPVADALMARKIPIIFATGYGRDGLRPGYRETTVLQKPFLIDDLEVALKDALRPAS
jgi:DNA-binding response OmpR family regulator